jgi:hypothetical protein
VAGESDKYTVSMSAELAGQIRVEFQCLMSRPFRPGDVETKYTEPAPAQTGQPAGQTAPETTIGQPEGDRPASQPAPARGALAAAMRRPARYASQPGEPVAADFQPAPAVLTEAFPAYLPCGCAVDACDCKPATVRKPAKPAKPAPAGVAEPFHVRMARLAGGAK